VDRFTWAVAGGVIAICVVALASVLATRAGQQPPDLSTPDGVAVAYALAVQNQDPDRAWGLLASPDAATLYGSPVGPPPGVVPAAPPAPIVATLPPDGTPTAVPTAAPPVPSVPTRPTITQEQFRQQIYNNQRRGPGKRIRITGVTNIAEDRARVSMEITSTDGGFRFPGFGFGGPSSSFTATFELQRQGSTWRITSAPPVFNFL